MQLLKRKITLTLIGLAAVLALAFFATVPALAAPSDAAAQACAGVTAAAGGTCDATKTGTDANELINTIINLLSWIIGVIAVIMIIFGGFKFVTSSGDSGKVSSARQTIIYALVGLVIVALAQTVVKFVIGQFI